MEPILDYMKRSSPHVAAVLQVSILNGTDLKTMINYTGEQVSQRAPASAEQKLLYALFFHSPALH